MLVYGIISPHAPIIIPSIGGAETAKVKATVAALEHAARELAAARPDCLVIISPHEGHGFEVPLHYLGQHLPPGISVEEVLVTERSYHYYYEYGRIFADKIRHSPKRYAIIASGDLSHVLKKSGPYGYNAAGPKLDKQIVAAVETGDSQALLGLDPQLLDDGAECGLRSVLFLLGATGGHDFVPEVRAYEGPFGVGYLTATYAPGPITSLAWQAVKHYLGAGQVMHAPAKLPAALKHRAACFVSLHTADGDLRGCIGTVTPAKASLAAEIIHNAVAAARDDPRFVPVTPAELDGLYISVDVLGDRKDGPFDDPKKYGVIVTASDGRRGVLLPDLDGVDTVADQIAIARDKAAIGPNEPVKTEYFTVTRYVE